MTTDLQNVRKLIACGAPLTVEARLQPGRRVRIKGGALMGLEGTIVCRRAETRLLIAVHYLQQGVSVQIDDYMVEPI
jgi:transcriptional antiterminator RfaH